MATVDEEILERLAKLTDEQKRTVLNYVLTMTGEHPRKLSGKELVEHLKSLPRVSDEFLEILRQVVEERGR